MHYLVAKLFEKRGITDLQELSKDEKNDYERWEKIFSNSDITVEKIGEFCTSQIKIIEGQWKNLDNSKEKNERLILLHTVYSTIKSIIDSPKAEREQLEKYLNQLLHS